MTKHQMRTNLKDAYFKSMPDDTELVFNTATRSIDCVKLRDRHLTYCQEPIAFAEDHIKNTREPIWGWFLRISTNPFE